MYSFLRPILHCQCWTKSFKGYVTLILQKSTTSAFVSGSLQEKVTEMNQLYFFMHACTHARTNARARAHTHGHSLFFYHCDTTHYCVKFHLNGQQKNNASMLIDFALERMEVQFTLQSPPPKKKKISCVHQVLLFSKKTTTFYNIFGCWSVMASIFP